MTKSEASDSEYGQAPACHGCFKWDIFHKKCWYYWDLKKVCSQWEASQNQAPPAGPQQPLPKDTLPKKESPLPQKPETLKPAGE